MHDEDISFSQSDPRTFRSLSLGACPACQSRRIKSREFGKQACATIGAIAGAASGLAGALSGAVTGAEVGMYLGDGAPSMPLGVVAGAVVGALSGGIAGCTVGASLGEAVDASILRNRCCLDCGHRFSVSPA